MNRLPAPIRILLVDDHPIVRAGLRSITTLDPRFQVIAEAASSEDAVRIALSEQPDVVLLDMRLGTASGIEVCRQIKSGLAHTKVLFLTSYVNNQLVLEALAAGADGYLMKENDVHRIASAIESLLRGETLLDPVANEMGQRAKQEVVCVNPLLHLTPQEGRVLAAVANGMTNIEVGQQLNLSPKTVRNYLANVFQKLGVNTRTQAAMIHTRWHQQRLSFHKDFIVKQPKTTEKWGQGATY
jgi:two-component system response regulator DevR